MILLIIFHTLLSSETLTILICPLLFLEIFKKKWMQEYAHKVLSLRNNEFPPLKEQADLLQCPKTKDNFQLDSIVNKYCI